MATENIEIEANKWQDLETVGDLTLTQGTVYTITCRGSGACEVVLADEEPTDNFLGHPAKADENFTFTYDDTKIWIKCITPVTVVIS